jgi:hypothetical protein
VLLDGTGGGLVVMIWVGGPHAGMEHVESVVRRTVGSQRSGEMTRHAVDKEDGHGKGRDGRSEKVLDSRQSPDSCWVQAEDSQTLVRVLVMVDWACVTLIRVRACKEVGSDCHWTESRIHAEGTEGELMFTHLRFACFRRSCICLVRDVVSRQSEPDITLTEQ